MRLYQLVGFLRIVNIRLGKMLETSKMVEGMIAHLMSGVHYLLI